jgi:alpha/beta superfamily hydrolase
MLEGLFTMPDRTPNGIGAVVCHPHPLYGGDMWNSVVSALAEAFVAAGCAVLRFNFRGVGNSTGTYGEGTDEQDDAKGALTWLAAQPGVNADKLWLAGYSFGARVSLAVAAADSRVRGFIAVAPPVLRGEWPPLQTFRGPKIFISGDEDPYAPPEVLTPWVNGLPDPKRLVILRGLDHFFLGHERTLGQQAVTLLHEFS